VTYNGDFFDFPFVDKRAKVHDIDMFQQVRGQLPASCCSASASAGPAGPAPTVGSRLH
jgi:hypothetical protein